MPSRSRESAKSSFASAMKEPGPRSASALSAGPRSSTRRKVSRAQSSSRSVPSPIHGFRIRPSRSTRSECTRGYPCRRASSTWRRPQSDERHKFAMDKLYKSHFLSHLKSAMDTRFPQFSKHLVPRDHPMREIFSGTVVYRAPVSRSATVWLCWEPGPGVERYFHVLLGWSPSAERLPQHHSHDSRIHGLSGPSSEFEAAALDLEQIEGKAGIGGITIPSPWDQILTVKAAAPKRLHQEIQMKAYAEAMALSAEERSDAVSRVIDDVCTRVQAQLPAFIERLRLVKHDA